jgi:lysophospholipase L1-like esterase
LATEIHRPHGFRREVLSRLALVTLGLVLALALLEAGLQIGAAYVRATGRQVSRQWTTRGGRVLCLGDSNTYGIWVDGSQAYPAVLQRLWNERERSQPIEILNLGIPGNNSSRLRNALPKLIALYRPDWVTIMIGVNDWWTVAEPVSSADTRKWVANFLWRWSRAFRLLFMIGSTAGTSALQHPAAATGYPAPRGPGPRPEDANFRWTKRPETFPDWERALHENLAAMVVEAERSGVKVALLTYPSQHAAYDQASNVLRAAARETGAPLVDLGAVFSPLCAPQPCDDLLYPDRHPALQHPTAKGHDLVARTLVMRLAELAL